MKPINAVWFSHGKESGPWGTKIRHLARVAASRGCHVESVDYRGIDDPEARTAKLLDLSPSAVDKLVLVGSSMGGYVACAASETLEPDGLFLMAPAVRLPGFGRPGVGAAGGVREAVHGWRDDVVPPEGVFGFCRDHGVDLHLIDCGHALRERLPDVVRLFEAFLDRLFLPR
jgi:hypothetical protein